MAVPTIDSLTPATGLAGGGELISIAGTGFAARISVTFDGEASPRTIGVTSGGDLTIVEAPPGSAGSVDVTLQNLDANGDPVVGESVTAAGAYTYTLPDLVPDSGITQITDYMLRRLRRLVPEGHSGPDSIAVDYDDAPGDGLRVLSLSKVPGLSLTGPRLEVNRVYRRPDRRYEDLGGGDSCVRGPSIAYDLVYSLTMATRHPRQLGNLIVAVIAGMHRGGRLRVGSLSWLLNVGDVRSAQPRDGVHVASVALRVVGFTVDEGVELSRASTLDNDPEVTVGILE